MTPNSLPQELWTVALQELAGLERRQAECEARWILDGVFGLGRSDLVINRKTGWSKEQLEKFRTALARRREGEPLAYVLGEQEFCGIPLLVNPHVLIPRNDTECLVQLARRFQGQKILDVGTGSGCIGLSIIKNRVNAKLMGLDISPEALRVARLNAERLDLSERATFAVADACDVDQLSAALGVGAFDIIVANPPYLDPSDEEIDPDVPRFEPHVALFSEQNGTYHTCRWVRNLLPYLNAGGLMAFEIGHRQRDSVTEIFSATKQFSEVYTEKDLAGLDRIVWARKALEG